MKCIFVKEMDGAKHGILFIKKGDWKAYLECRNWNGHCFFKTNKTVEAIEYIQTYNSDNTLSVNYNRTFSFSSNYMDGRVIDGKHSEVLYATFDVYTDNTFTDFFFQTEKVQITQIAQVGQLVEIMMKVIKMIMPIGLIIFGMLLLILLVRYVILRMT